MRSRLSAPIKVPHFVLLALGAVALLLTASVGVSDAATTPAQPSLAGETLSQPGGVEPFCLPTGQFNIPGGVGGDATGPYPGTFFETLTGTADFTGPGSSGPVLTFQAQFEIDANDGTVIIGTKTLHAPGTSGTARCSIDPLTCSATRCEISATGIISDYTAQITSPSGSTTTDQGTATTTYYHALGSGVQTSNFTETFGALKPGQGCGDKNHSHEREPNCKKPVG